MEEAFTREVLSDQLGADDLAVTCQQRTVRLVIECELTDTPYDHGVDAAGDDQQGNCDADGDDEVSCHCRLLCQMNRMQQQINRLDPNDRNDYAADAVQQQGPPNDASAYT